MTDRELTRLAFLADALTSSPGGFAELIAQAMSGIAEPSQEFAAIVKALELAFRGARPSAAAEVAALAKKLSESRTKAQSRAGHVLGWGLDLAEAEDSR